jgi:HK97 family phage portal protein
MASASVLSRLLGATADPTDDRYFERSGGGGSSLAGTVVTAATALTVSAVYRAVSIIANVLAMLPAGVYEEQERGSRRAYEHPMDFRLRLRPNARQTSFEWRRQVFTCLLLRQNAYCQMVPAERGAFDLVPLHPDRITGPEETPSGERRFWYTPPQKTRVPLLEGVDLWHVQGLSEDGLRGLSLIDLARDSIGIAKASQEHSAHQLGRGLTFRGVLEHPGRLTPTTATEMGDSFGRTYGGRVGVGKVPVLWEGMKFNPITMTNQDAQFLESQKFGIADVARWFGIPPHLLSDVEKATSWGSGMEEQNLQFLIVTLLPWIVLFEQAYRLKLLLRPERFYPKLNVNAMLRVSAKTRFDVFQLGIQNGILSPNECREMDDLNPREGGDTYVTPTAPQQSPRGSGPPSPSPPPVPSDENASARLLMMAEALALRLRDESDAPTAIAEAVVAKTEATDEAKAREAAANARARALAQATAERIVAHERASVAGLSTSSGSNPPRWRHAVTSFYGRHAAFVAESLCVELEAARAYCRTQAARVEGPDLSEWSAASAVAELVALSASAPPPPSVVVQIQPSPVAVQVAAPSVSIESPRITVPVLVEAAKGPQEFRIVGPVEALVTEMPLPPVKDVEVTQRDPQGRIKRTRETPKGGA